MKTKTLLFALFLIASLTPVFSKEKKIWANSFLGKTPPKIQVEGWISDKPSIKKDQYTLIDFWATWCAPCRKAIPDLNKWHKEFNERLVVIGISSETKDKVTKMKSPQIKYYSGFDTKQIMKNKLGIKGIPHIIIINPK